MASETPDATTAAIGRLLDQVIADPGRRDEARRELMRLADGGAFAAAEARSADAWTSRARPSFLYVMYALLLWAIPLGLIAAVRPTAARAIAAGMTAYLAGIPEPLYALFATGYLGYTVAREWGKANGR